MFFLCKGEIILKLTERLYESVKEIWESYNSHPFVKGIAYGTLPIENFKFYMLQDHLYLLQYAKVFALGLIKSNSERDMRLFARLISDTLDTENKVHQDYLKKLGITREDIDNAKTSIVTDSYTNYMISIAFKEGLEELAVSVLACAWSYKLIGDFMETVPNSKNHKFYGHWINTYTSKEFRDSIQIIMDMVDRLGKGYSEEQIQNLEKILINCSRYEYMFWDMAWNKEM